MVTTPRLLGRVASFLGLTTGVSAVLGLAWIRVAWSAHMRFIGSLLGSGFLATAATILLLLGEAAIPATVLFSHRLEGLQTTLFDETLKQQGAEVHSVGPAERERMTSFLALQRQKGKAAPPKINLPGPLGGLANEMAGFAYKVVVPRPKEGFLVRRTRDLVTLPIKLSLPMLLPVFALAMDGPAEAASLHQHWLEKKGLGSSDEQLAVMQKHKNSYRAFGAVASTLNYIPVLSWFLSLSNAVGAGLWAADIEKKGGALFPGGPGISSQAPATS